MKIWTALLSSLLAAAAAAPLSAQNPTGAPAPAAVRTLIASSKLATVTDRPVGFKIVSVTLAAGQTTTVSVGEGILYQLTGATDVTVAGKTTNVASETGILLPAGQTATIKAGSTEATFLHFYLASQSDLGRPAEAAPAVVRELYRNAAAIPDLKAGAYDLNLTQVTFPAGMPSNAPHHRSGAAVYYIVSGSGVQTVNNVGTPHGATSVMYEPYSLMHQWGNPGAVAMKFLAFNINPEGVAAVLNTPPER